MPETSSAPGRYDVAWVRHRRGTDSSPEGRRVDAMEMKNGGGLAVLLASVVVAALAGARLKPGPDQGAPLETPGAAGGANEPATSLKPGDTYRLARPLAEVLAFFGAPTRPLNSVEEAATAISGLAADHEYRLGFVIALLPDPLDSYIGGEFDALLSAIIRGASRSGWLLDRHWLPWDEGRLARAEQAGGKPESSPGRHSPGIVLFRSPAPDRHLLAILLVGESPITGVQTRPFQDTLRFISRLASRAPELVFAHDARIRVLGPFASGSASSIARSLERWCSTDTFTRNWTVAVLSGSATNPQVAELIQPSVACRDKVKTTFQATVIPDDVLEEQAHRFFNRLGWHPSEVALLTESDTAYGQQKLPQYETSVPAVVSDRQQAHWRLLLPVPSGLGGVRSALEKGRKFTEIKIGDTPVPPSALQLKLEETRSPGDVVREFGDLSPPIDELKLHVLLSTLARERIRHLGLVFTDVRDKLFLVEKIRKHAHHVSLFTFETNILYVHPRLNAYTDGMLVISSYPATTEAQRLFATNRDLFGSPEEDVARRLQFSTDAEHGVYNATVLVLSELEESAGAPSRRAPLVDYFPLPGSGGAGPAVWISAVGHGRLVPLAAIRSYGIYERPGSATTARAGEHTLPVSLARISVAEPLRFSVDLLNLLKEIRVPGVFRFCVWWSTLGLLMLGLFWAVGHSHASSRVARAMRVPVFFRPLLRADPSERRQHLVWTLLLFSGSSALWIALSSVYLVPFLLRWRAGLPVPDTDWRDFLHDDWPAMEERFMRGVIQLMPLIAIALVAFLAYLGWRLGEHLDQKKIRWRAVGAVALGTAMGVPLLLAWMVLEVFNPAAAGTPESNDRLVGAVFTFARASSAHVSPLLGSALLSGGFLWIVFCQLRRLHVRDNWSSELPFVQPSTDQDISLRSLPELHRHLDRRIRQPAPRSKWFWAPLALGLGPFFLVFLTSFEASCDTPVWGDVFAILFVLLLISVLASFYRFTSLWRGLGRILRRYELSRFHGAFLKCHESLQWYALKAWGAKPRHTYTTLLKSVEYLRGLSRRTDLPKPMGKSKSKPSEDGDKSPGSILGSLAEDAQQRLSEVWLARADRRADRERDARVKVLAALDSASNYVQGMLNELDPESKEPKILELRTEMTEFLALRSIAYIRYVFAEIRNSLLAFTFGILFLLAGLASFHFQPLKSVFVVLWAVIVLIVVWTVAIFVQMDRDSILSSISGTTPGQLNPLKSSLLPRVLTFAVPPVVALVLTQFPQVGQPLLSWLAPLMRLFQ